MTPLRLFKLDRAERFWRVVAFIAVLCLSLNTFIAIRNVWIDGVGKRGLRHSPAGIGGRSGGNRVTAPAPVVDWAHLSARGHLIGPPDAPVTIVVFSDHQCPYCARFANETLPELRRRFPNEFKLLVRHWPLASHVWAYAAARAAECAADQGMFEVYHNLLFRTTRILGPQTFLELAREARIADPSHFADCAKSRSPVPAIEEGIADVLGIGGRGTPTFVINGTILRPPYTPDALSAEIERQVAALAKH